MGSKSNKRYWDSWNSRYSDVWKPPARQEMSKKETDYIVSKIPSKKNSSLLDIGVGNGRILDVLSKKSARNTTVYGLDISQKMVEICNDRFRDNKKIKKIEVCDLSSDTIPYKTKFSLITVIRVLKYNSNWKKMLKKIYDQLESGGGLVFTMPNNQSVSIFSGDTFSDQNTPIIYTNPSDLNKVLRSVGFKNIEILAFSKVPNFLYHLSNHKYYVRFLLVSERLLEAIFGNTLFGRELFIFCNK